MAAYIVVQVEVQDQATYGEYVKLVPRRSRRMADALWCAAVRRKRWRETGIRRGSSCWNSIGGAGKEVVGVSGVRAGESDAAKIGEDGDAGSAGCVGTGDTSTPTSPRVRNRSGVGIWRLHATPGSFGFSLLGEERLSP